MGLFNRNKKAQATPQPTTVESLNMQIANYNKKEYSIKAMENGLQRTINGLLDNIKKNPQNQMLVNMAKKQLQMLYTKKLMYQKFSYMVSACKMQLTAKRDEMLLTGGEKVLDPAFINSMNEVLGKCDSGMQNIEAATTIEQLQAQFDSYMDMASLGTGDDIASEVARQVEQSLASALGTTQQTQNQAQTSNVQKEEAVIDDTEKLLNSYKNKLN